MPRPQAHSDFSNRGTHQHELPIPAVAHLGITLPLPLAQTATHFATECSLQHHTWMVPTSPNKRELNATPPKPLVLEGFSSAATGLAAALAGLGLAAGAAAFLVLVAPVAFGLCLMPLCKPHGYSPTISAQKLLLQAL